MKPLTKPAVVVVISILLSCILALVSPTTACWFRSQLYTQLNQTNKEEDSTTVTSLVRRIEQKAKAYHSDSFLILHNGKNISEWNLCKHPHLIETMSVTKSVIGVVVGTLLQKGKIESLEQCVSDFFPEWKNTAKEKITIRQLMEQSSGLADQPTTEEIYASKDIVKLALDSDLMYTPGQYRFYSNKAVNLLPAIVEKATGQRFNAYVQKELFAPLEIRQYLWQRDKTGNYFGFAGLQLTAYDLAKIGQLMLQKGRWNGIQIISEDFVNQSTANHVEYGLLWWIYDGPPALFAAQGYNGQAIVVCPSAQLVCVRQIDCKRFKSENDNFHELINMISQLCLEIQKQPATIPQTVEKEDRKNK